MPAMPFGRSRIALVFVIRSRVIHFGSTKNRAAIESRKDYAPQEIVHAVSRAFTPVRSSLLFRLELNPQRKLPNAVAASITEAGGLNLSECAQAGVAVNLR